AVRAEPRNDVRAHRTERHDVELQIRQTGEDLAGARDTDLRVVEIEARKVEIEPWYHGQLGHVQAREALHVEAVLEGVPRVAYGHADAAAPSYGDESFRQADLGRSHDGHGREHSQNRNRTKHDIHGSSGDGYIRGGTHTSSRPRPALVMRKRRTVARDHGLAG